MKGMALRDGKELYDQIGGKPGLAVEMLSNKRPKIFEPAKFKLRRIEEFRGKIVAHGIVHLEEAEGAELWDILTGKVNWHQRKPLPEPGAYVVVEFKNLAEEIMRLTIEVMDHIQRSTFRQPPSRGSL